MYKYIDGKAVELTLQEKKERQQLELAARSRRNKIEYRLNRASEYPPIGDQLDAIIKKLCGNGTEFDELCDLVQSIKQKYPKPE